MFKFSLPTLILSGLLAVSARADVTVDAAKIVRPRPATIGGVVINAHSDEFATNAGGINFQADLKAAKVGIVRHLSYPDARFLDDDKGKFKDLAYFDKTTQAILDAGAQQLFIEYIKPAEKMDKDVYFKEDGTMGGTPITNLIYSVKHYMAPPFNIKKQYWQIGNEPDIGIDYAMNTQDYSALFNEAAEALKKAGLRENVVLCGPVVTSNYNWPRAPKEGESSYLDYFMEHCKDNVDVIDFHTYTGADNESGLMFGHKLDKQFDANRTFETDPKNGKLKDYYGVAAMISKMKTIQFGRPSVGIAITEHNVHAFTNRVVAGLWNLAVTHYWLYNPYGQITTQFVFDDFGGQQGHLGAYDNNKNKRYSYWALWIRGNLTGEQVLEQTVTPNASKSNFSKGGDAYLLVTGTKDATHVYVEVINRGLEPVKDHVELKNCPNAGAPLIHVMSESVPPIEPPRGQKPPAEPDVIVPGITPDKSTQSQLGTSFDYEFPPLSATIFEFPIGAK